MTLEQFLETKIPIVEIFCSVSGEGITQGQLVTFVRTAGCNLRCSYCDTTYSYNESGKDIELLTPEEILIRVKALGCREIICTGGEPLEEGKPKRFVPYYLASKGFNVRIETNGSCRLGDGSPLFEKQEAPVFYVLDVKCPSSGMSQYNIFEENFNKLRPGDELKFVMADEEDIRYALDVIDRYKKIFSEKQVVINFSSVFGKLPPEKIVKVMIEKNSYFMDNGIKVRLSLQIHKFIWKPETRGV